MSVWACLCVHRLLHPAKHLKHVRLDVFMCSSPPSPCPLIHVDTPRWVCVFVSILTQRERVYPSPLCCYFDVARRGLTLLVYMISLVNSLNSFCSKLVTRFLMTTCVEPVQVLRPMGFTKPMTRTCQNPYPWLRVRVSTGMGAGSPGKPQGCP